MQNAFRLFGEKDTGSFESRFGPSRLMLTGVYVAILLVILCVSTSVTRALFSRRLDVRFHPMLGEEVVIREDRLLPPDPSMVRKDLTDALFLVNGSLLLLAGVSSFWLAEITLRPIKRAYQKQRQFLSDASHELRTPLAILQTDLENERAEAGDTKTISRLDSHLEEVRRMGRLVNDLLLLSRLGEARKDVPAPQKTPVAEVVEKTFERLLRLASERGITFVPPRHLPDLYVDIEKEVLLQALTNVVKNAILYNKPNGTVSMEVVEVSGQVLISVCDTGLGMSPEDTVQVFDRFYRADRSRSRETGGSGLGLSIAQSAIEQAGGSISLVSTPNKGTTVTITLPVHTAS